MTEFHTAGLDDRGVVAVKGADSEKFLQGLITNDLDTLKTKSALFTGLLSPQGKILFDFFVVPTDDGFSIDIAKEHVEALIKRLTLYRLRAAVAFEDKSEIANVVAVWGGTLAETAGTEARISFPDPRHSGLGLRLLFDPNDSTSATSPSLAYHEHRIGLGIPEGGRDYVFADTYPHEALYNDLHGISFSKGCFIGQEVVSRMEHRKATKKRIVMVESDRTLPKPGTDITAGDISLGRLGSSANTKGLALIRIDRLKDVAKQDSIPIADGVALEISKPNWATYEIS